METSALTAPRSTATATATPRAGANSDYNTFLRMLTTQMQNQDPLNPIDSADYAVQLATFSSVEQQTLTNQLMKELIGSMGTTGLSEFAGWVGKDVRSNAAVAYDGTPVTLSITPDAAANRAILAVRNAQGVVVAREDMTPGSTAHVWDGTGMTGNALPSGRYSFRVESYAGETLLSERPPETYARVTEVRSGSAGTRIVLSGGIEIGADQITALRGGN